MICFKIPVCQKIDNLIVLGWIYTELIFWWHYVGLFEVNHQWHTFTYTLYRKNCLHTHFHVLALIEIFLILLLIIIKNMYLCLKNMKKMVHTSISWYFVGNCCEEWLCLWIYDRTHHVCQARNPHHWCGSSPAQHALHPRNVLHQ